MYFVSPPFPFGMICIEIDVDLNFNSSMNCIFVFVGGHSSTQIEGAKQEGV